MPTVELCLPPLGVAFIHDEREPAPPCRVLSYCDALRRAAAGEELLLRPDSITACRWSPVVLGLKEAESGFEKRQEPRLQRTQALFVAPLAAFEARDMRPDVAIVRDEPQVLRYLAFMAGKNDCAREHADELDKSALGYLWDKRSDWRIRLITAVNHSLYLTRKQAWFRELTASVFRSELVSDGFDRIISRTMATMSLCRNSTVIPHKSGLVNISFFCTGGILWGGNSHQHMTSGWPYPLFEELRKRVKLTW